MDYLQAVQKNGKQETKQREERGEREFFLEKMEEMRTR